MKAGSLSSLLAGLALLLAGCSTAYYSAPDATAVQPFNATVEADYDTVWTALIDHASQNFFAIENFEKDSGLLTLSFGSSMPSTFIDCGWWVLTGPRSFNGTYVDYLSQNGAAFTGRMNITVRSLAERSTTVRVNARYQFVYAGVNMPGTIYAQSFRNAWTFDSGSSATIQVSPAAPGAPSSRTCQPSYEAEQSIINAVASLSN